MRKLKIFMIECLNFVSENRNVHTVRGNNMILILLDGVAGCLIGIPIALLTGLAIFLICK